MGSWTAMNKIVPNIYNNFVAVPRAKFENPSALGIIAVGLIMGWGKDGDVTELYSEDLLTSASLNKVGYTINDEEILPFRLALTSAYKGLFYKLNSGGEKATATIGDVTFTAKYTGVVGNKIGITIKSGVPAVGQYTLQILVNGAVKEIKTITSIADFETVKSNWVDISVATGGTDIEEATNTLLTGGTNGTVGATAYDDFFSAIRYKKFSVVCVMSTDSSAQTKIIDFVNNMVNNKQNLIQGVVYNKPALDNEYVFEVHQGMECNDFTITTELMPIAMGTLRAGNPLGESLTDANLTEIFGAKKIINPLDDSDDTAKGNAIAQGRFCIHYINDGSIRVLKDINTLVSVDDDKPEYYQKNTTIQTLNFMLNEEYRLSHDGRIGKYQNSPTKRNLLASAYLEVFKDAQARGAIAPYDSETDCIVSATEQADVVKVDQRIKLRGNIEFIYMTTYTDISTL